jgi:hypothetical protein
MTFCPCSDPCFLGGFLAAFGLACLVQIGAFVCYFVACKRLTPGTCCTAIMAAAKLPAHSPRSLKSKLAAPVTAVNGSKHAVQAASPANAAYKPPKSVL